MSEPEAIDTPMPCALELARSTRHPFRKLYYWTLHWADTRYGVPALFVISFLESSIFPIPPDVLLMPLCFAQPKKWVQYAVWCTLASIIGGVVGWMIGAWFWDAVGPFFFQYVPGFTQAKFDKMAGMFSEYGFWIILVKGLTPIPYKLITITSGVFHFSIWQLIVASVISRAGRFFLVAGLIRAFGPKVRPFLEKHFDKALLMVFVGLVLGFAVLKFL
jgi:membrane protein YqaA with SNARE-associated domain